MHAAKSIAKNTRRSGKIWKHDEYLKTLGRDVTTLPVDGYGCIVPEDLRLAFRPGTFLVSVMYQQ